MNSNQKLTYLEDSIVKDFAEKLDLYSPEMEKNKEKLLEENPMLEDKLKDLFKSVTPPSPKLVVTTPAPVKAPLTKAKIDWIGNEPKFELAGQIWRLIPNHTGLQPDLIKYCKDRGAHLPTKSELDALELHTNQSGQYISTIGEVNLSGKWFWSSSSVAGVSARHGPSLAPMAMLAVAT